MELNLFNPDCQGVEVTRIIDGDTFDSSVGRARLYGMDTPERGERCFQEATNRLASLAGEGVRVEPGPSSADPYGRRLLYMYAESGESIDEILVKEDYAVAWRRDGQHRDYLTSLELTAQSSGVGCLW